jgi:hypothetical protein
VHATLWIVIAIGAAFAASLIMVRRAQRVLPPIVLPAGEKMPTTALQRLAWQCLGPVLVLTLAAAAMVAYHGVDVWWSNDHVRLTATGLLLAALGVFTYWIARVRMWLMRDDGTLDERDRGILSAAPAGQAPAMMVTLAAWMISLTETYQATHLVPSAFLYLIFWSLLMVSILASLVGILVGYRRS